MINNLRTALLQRPNLPLAVGIVWCPSLPYCAQSITPRLSDVVVTALLAHIESDTFRGSRRMCVEDLAVALPEEAVTGIPGLPTAPAITVKRALRDAKQRLTTVTVSTAASGTGAPAVM